MEYITFEHDFTSPSTPAADGYTKSQIYLLSALKYFDMGKMVVPFGGIGLGWGKTEYDDGISRVDRDWNLAL